MEHAIEDKENLRLQVQDYIKEVGKCENVITQKVRRTSVDIRICIVFFFVFPKESDRTTIFEQYREATNELTRAKLTLTDMESQIGNLRQELQIKASDNKRYTERVDYLERELQQVEENLQKRFR